MRLDTDGVPIITQKGDQERLDSFLDLIVAELYGRLPRLVKMFLSEDALRGLLGTAAARVTARAFDSPTGA